MPGSPAAGTVHISPTVHDRPAPAAEEQDEPDRVRAIAMRSHAGPAARAVADGRRTIPADLRVVTGSLGAVCAFELEIGCEREWARTSA
jgi:hypothetical protein